MHQHWIEGCHRAAGQFTAGRACLRDGERTGSVAQLRTGHCHSRLADVPPHPGPRRFRRARTPALTGSLSLVADVKLDGAVYGSPIVVDGPTLVATENDSVSAFDSAYLQI